MAACAVRGGLRGPWRWTRAGRWARIGAVSKLPLPILLAFLGGCAVPATGGPEPWIDLSPRPGQDGLGGWESVSFGGEAEVERTGSGLRFGYGVALTGVRWASPELPDGRPLPREDYELEVVAVRLGGADFFCGLSFPVGDGGLSLILGGWGGSLCGLSCIDGADASANPTTRYRRFESGRPYRARVRVQGGRVAVWLDDEALYDLPVAGRRLELRAEIRPGGPLGVARFQTAAEIRSLRIRRLPPVGREAPERSR